MISAKSCNQQLARASVSPIESAYRHQVILNARTIAEVEFCQCVVIDQHLTEEGVALLATKLASGEVQTGQRATIFIC